MQPLIFQAIDWVINDIELNDKNSDDELEQLSDGSLENFNKKKTKKYLIKIFGRTAKGNSISVNIKDYTPYFYIKLTYNWSKIVSKSYCKKMFAYFTSDMNKKVWKKFRNCLINMDIVENNIKLQLNSLTNLGELEDEFIENTIICLCQLIKTTHHKINMTNVMIDITKLIDMGFLSKRLKFKLLDIKDLCSK